MLPIMLVFANSSSRSSEQMFLQRLLVSIFHESHFLWLLGYIKCGTRTSMEKEHIQFYVANFLSFFLPWTMLVFVCLCECICFYLRDVPPEISKCQVFHNLETWENWKFVWATSKQNMNTLLGSTLKVRILIKYSFNYCNFEMSMDHLCISVVDK